MVGTEGKLIWITGLAGAGKTTVGSLLYEELKKIKSNTVVLDGDILRNIYDDSDYSIEGRMKTTYRTSRLCKVLTQQNINVVCCVIAMFDECRKWNRENIDNYLEVYVKVSMDTLIKRDQKKFVFKVSIGKSQKCYGYGY